MNMKVMKSSPLDIMKKLNILGDAPKEQTVKQKSVTESRKVGEAKPLSSNIEISLDLSGKVSGNEDTSAMQIQSRPAQKSADEKPQLQESSQTEVLKKREAIENGEDLDGETEEEYEESETHKRMRMMGFPSQFISRRDLRKKVKS